MVLFGGFFALLFLRVPVAFALGLACLPILIIEPRLDTVTLMSETFNAFNSFILLGGAVLPAHGEPHECRRRDRSADGRCPGRCRAFSGGLAQINVVLCPFLAGISGSSTADAASQSKIFIEAQRKEGYDDSFSVAITAVSAVLAVIIPPSILMIVWGGISPPRLARCSSPACARSADSASRRWPRSMPMRSSAATRPIRAPG